MIESWLRRALDMLRLIILAGITNLSAFALTSGIYFALSAPAVASPEHPPRGMSVAVTSQRADQDDDDKDGDDDCDDDDEDD